MDRRDFLKTSGVGAAALAASGLAGGLVTSCAPAPKKEEVELKLSFQEGTAPRETLDAKLDYMEEMGIVGLEPGGRGLSGRVNEFQQALRGRNIKISAVCAGFDGFILAEDPAVKAEFDSTMRDIIGAAGALGSTGVIMVPAFNGQEPCLPHNQKTRDYLCEELAKLGEYALKCGTTVILEPLNRGECFYLRLVSDAAAICRDCNCEGVKCMGDFWHMKEETSDYAAFLSAGPKYLQHVHMASRGRRALPGEDGELDCYVDGFRALKEMKYDKYVSFECGCKGDKEVDLPAAVALLREQWAKA